MDCRCRCFAYEFGDCLQGEEEEVEPEGGGRGALQK